MKTRDAVLLGIGGLLLLAGGGIVSTKDAEKNKAKYKPTIDAAERANAIPAGMLFRLINKESAFRSDIISGQKVSSAGAVGIAQIVPKWHPHVDPRDPVASINYAAKYLAGLYRDLKDWRLALAAYNWGIGNVKGAIAKHGRENVLAYAPRETQDYVRKIA